MMRAFSIALGVALALAPLAGFAADVAPDIVEDGH